MDALNFLFLTAFSSAITTATAVSGIKIYQLCTKGKAPEQYLLHNKSVENLQRLANATLAEMPSLVRMQNNMDFRNYGPHIYPGMFGYKNEREFNKVKSALVGSVSLMTGLAAVAIYSVSMVRECVGTTKNLSYCTDEFAAFLEQGQMAAFLLIGGLTLGNVVRDLFLKMLADDLTVTWFNVHRNRIIGKEFNGMSSALTEMATKAANSPEEKESVKQLAQAVLRAMPLIREQLERVQDFRMREIEALVMPLETTCRRILI
jgi:hypothetical protein